MCVIYIVAITAFTVNQSSHIPLNLIILWFGPTIIITPIIVFELKKIKLRLCKLFEGLNNALVNAIF
jgi:hypothetical protein